jgi:hypothetical protein
MSFSWKLWIQPTNFFVLVILPFSLLRAQSNANGPYDPLVFPPSPNASALMRFTDVPVSPYTGTADITVPIYTIQAKGISVPITLSYHTGGIKLKEEASWVGLGWALNAGGMISRTVIGHDDFGSDGKYYLTTAIPQLEGDITNNQPPQGGNPYCANLEDLFCSYLVNTSAGTEDFYLAFTGGNDAYDLEPDIFNYNFPGHSGKFILTRSGSVIMQKQENIKIQFQGTQSNVTFTITDDQGNKFYFNVLEKSQYSSKPAQISSWLLSKIVTEQQDSINFNYTAGDTTLSTVVDHSQTSINYCTAINGFYDNTGLTPLYYNQNLQSIDFSGGHLQFGFDNKRSDLYGGYKLDSLMIYSKNVVGTQTYLKQENFYYSYFNSTYHPSDSTDLYRLKLDSVKEKSCGYSLTPYSFIYNNPNPGPGSEKHLYGADHWGYCNGANNNTLIPSMNVLYNPPEKNNQIVFPQYMQYNGANRQPNFTYMQNFSLQQIIYPTGGKTALAYQANDYDYNNSVTGRQDEFAFVQTEPMDSQIVITHHGTATGTIDLTNIYPSIPPITGGYNVNVTIGFRYLKNDTFPYSSQSGNIYFNIFGADQDIHTANCVPGSNICTTTFSMALGAGVYSWTANIDPSIDTVGTFAGIYVGIQYNVSQQVYNQKLFNNYVSPGGGLRVVSITNYKDANNIASEKVYSYTYSQDKLGTGQPQQYSYGRLMSMPIYAHYALSIRSDGSYCTSLNLFGNSIASLTSANQGNIIGYDRVTEYSVDPLTGQDIGETVYNYFNSSDSNIVWAGFRLPGIFNIGNNLNGLLLSKINYANNGGQYYKVDETDYNYHATNHSIYYNPKYQYLRTVGGLLPGVCAGDTMVEAQTMAWFYPSLKSERVLLDNTTKIIYQQGDQTKNVTSTETNFYDNPVHYQITKSMTIDSKGNTLINRLKYPQDYISGNAMIDSMIGRNMVSVTIEKQDSLYYSGSPTGYVTGAQLSLYRQLGTSLPIVPDKIYKLDVQSPVTNFQPFSFTGNTISMDSRNRLMASFDQYDANNNIQQYTTTDQNPVSIIWDYSHVYPIAQAKNAVITDVAATSFEADGYGNWSPYTGTVTTVSTAPFPPTGNNYYNLTTSATLSKSGLVSGNVYIISYWSKNGSYSITGGTGSTVTGKTINGWTYYENKIITSSSTLTISGTGAIDEVRLYPSNALMTTYTYSPLIGMSTSCDPDNKVTYYFFDGLGRLKWVKDQDGNILKTLKYHYLGGQ